MNLFLYQDFIRSAYGISENLDFFALLKTKASKINRDLSKIYRANIFPAVNKAIKMYLKSSDPNVIQTEIDRIVSAGSRSGFSCAGQF